jgi:ribosomal protein L31E
VILTTKEERNRKKIIKQSLESLEFSSSDKRSLALEYLSNLGITDKLDTYFTVMKEDKFLKTINIVDRFVSQNKSLRNIYISVEKASKVVFALRKFLNTNIKTEKKTISIREELEKVIKVYDEVKNKVPEKIKSEKDYQKLLDYVILSLYVLNEPRRNMDYLNMGIIKGLPEVYEVKDGGEDNYLNLDKNEFVFNNFKNVKSIGRQIIPFNEDFRKVINLYIKHHKGIEKNKKKYFAYLLVDKDGHRINKVNYITNTLNRLFKKKVGSSLLRHIYITYKFGDVNKEQENTAFNMAHSTGMQKEYIKYKD